jgi:PAS domain S-box-containing protein
LAAEAQRCAAAFSATELQTLASTTKDVSPDEYSALLERLQRVLAANPAIISGAIFRVAPTHSTKPILVEPAAAVSTFLAPDRGTIERLKASAHPAPVPSGATTADPWLASYAEIGPDSAYLIALHFRPDHGRSRRWSDVIATAANVWLFLILPLATLITTRRQTRQRDALRNLTEAMEQGQSAVIIVTLDQRIEYANAGLCRQVGYHRRELIGREWGDLHAASTRVDIMVGVMTSIRAGESWAGEWTMRRKDASLFPVRGSVTPVKDRSGTIRSLVAVFEDVTEIRRTESLLREAKDRAEAGDRAKGQFLATMSHEVRTPLNGIVGFASLLLDTELTPEQQEFVETIRTSSETLIQLTGDILDYARIESGRLKLELQPCDARECVENALDLAAATAVQKNIELLHWIDEGVPPVIIADVGRLRQVLVNLVNNAVKFTQEGEVEVRVRALPPESGPRAEQGVCVLEFSVRDTGIGMAAEHHGKIFRPFSQVDQSTTRRFGGTGLGLAICKNIVELMDGQISFTSEPGRGSTFTFTVRVSAPPPEELGLERSGTPLRGQRLMVVSESDGLRDELSRLGSRLGAEVTARPTLTLGPTTEWDLALVDISGARAMELSATPSSPSGSSAQKMIALVPILLPGELRTALRGHFRIVLNKPLHHEMLATLLAPTPNAQAIPVSKSISAQSSGPRELHVLIVEDNPVNQQLVQKILTNQGCRWTSVTNGRAALEQLTRSAPNIVLMDLHMPELDGLSAITRIRAGDAGAALRDVWIIALTADARSEQRQRTLAAGANDYLTKPVQVPELKAAIARYVQSSV